MEQEMAKEPMARIEWKFTLETYMHELWVLTWLKTGG